MTLDKSGERIRGMFGQIAKRYDFLNHFLSCGIDIHWRNVTARAVDSATTGPILDACTGTGDLAIALSKRLGPDRLIVGTDFTHEMLVLAAGKIERLGANGGGQTISLLEADTQALPFAEGLFSAVTIAFGLRNVTETRRGLAELIRVCRPGGQVLVLEFSRPNASVLGMLYRWYFRYLLPRVGQSLARNHQSAYEYLPASVAEFPSGEELLAVMADCGLENLSHRPLTFGIATLYLGHKPLEDDGPGRVRCVDHSEKEAPSFLVRTAAPTPEAMR